MDGTKVSFMINYFVNRNRYNPLLVMIRSGRYSTSGIKYFFVIMCCVFLVHKIQAQPIRVQIVSDEAKGILAVLEKKKKNQAISDADWQNIFKSEGYIRLKKRELSFKRPFEDEDFKQFVLSDDLLRRFELLKNTLLAWEKANISDSARSALKYLPKHSQIHAKIYPVIKPRENSFVFEVEENPAIFLYLDPNVTKEQFENNLAHELHHIGYGTACPSGETDAEIKRFSEEKQTVLKWTTGFGEGLAMLAAAGSPTTHPHKFSKLKDRERWDRDVQNFNQDLKKVEAFFMDVLAKRLTGDKINETAFSFFGTQGAWYTVGWKMSVVIEKTLGRKKLIEVFCDHRNLLRTYNEAVGKYNSKNKENLAAWSKELISQLA